MFENDLADFGRSIGIDGLALNAKDCIALDIEKEMSLYIEKLDGTIFFYMLKNYEAVDISTKDYREALELGYNHFHYPFKINPVAKGDSQVGFFVKMKETDCAVSTIHKLVNFLMQMINSLTERVSANP